MARNCLIVVLILSVTCCTMSTGCALAGLGGLGSLSGLLGGGSAMGAIAIGLTVLIGIPAVIENIQNMANLFQGKLPTAD